MLTYYYDLSDKDFDKDVDDYTIGDFIDDVKEYKDASG